MGVLGNIWVKLGLKSDDFRKGMDQSEQRVSKFGQATQKMSMMAKAAWLAVGAAVIKFGKESVKAYNEQMAANAKLQNAIKNTNGALGLSYRELEKYASQIQSSFNVADDAAMNAMATMTTFGSVTGKMFKDAMQAAVDMAAFMKTDLNSAVMQLGKALEIPEIGLSMLRRSGVVFTNEQIANVKKLLAEGKKYEAQQLILIEVQKKFGGAAAAAAETAGGKWAGFKLAVGDLMETLGSGVEKTKGVANALKEVVEYTNYILSSKHLSAWEKFWGIMGLQSSKEQVYDKAIKAASAEEKKLKEISDAAQSAADKYQTIEEVQNRISQIQRKNNDKNSVIQSVQIELKELELLESKLQGLIIKRSEEEEADKSASLAAAQAAAEANARSKQILNNIQDQIAALQEKKQIATSIEEIAAINDEIAALEQLREGYEKVTAAMLEMGRTPLPSVQGGGAKGTVTTSQVGGVDMKYLMSTYGLGKTMFESLDIAELFGDVERKSTETLERLVKMAKTHLKTARGLSVDEIERIKDAIERAEESVAQRNPFKSLVKALREYRAAKKTGEGGEDELFQVKTATAAVQDYMQDMFSIAGEIGSRIGAEWAGMVDNIGRSLNSVFSAINTDKLSSKITGIVSAVMYALDALSDLANKRMLDNAENAANNVDSVIDRINRIADEKGIGDSLFTDDMFARVQNYGKAVSAAFDQIDSSFAMFSSQFTEHFNNLLGSQIADFDPFTKSGELIERMFNISAEKFKEQNEAAYRYLSTLSKANLTTAADIEKALLELDKVSKQTSSELGTAYLEQARGALETALEYTKELEGAIRQMVGDIGAQLLDVILQARREGTLAIADIQGAISNSLEDMLAQQLWASTMGQVFSQFGDTIKDAISSGDQSAITEAYTQLFDSIIQKQGEFYSQLDMAEQMAKAAGLSIFGVTGDSSEQMQSDIDTMRLYLEGLQETLDGINVEELRAELKSLTEYAQGYERMVDDSLQLQKEIEDLQRQEDEALRRNDEATAEMYSQQIAEKQKILGEIMGELAKGEPDYERLAFLEDQLTHYEYAADNIDMVRQRVQAMEQELENYIGTLAYYDEKIAGITAEMEAMNAEELATEAGQSRLAALKEQLKGFENLREALDEILFGGGDAETAGKVEGSIAWLNEEIGNLTEQLENLSHADYMDENIGGKIQAKIDEYNAILQTMTDFYAMQDEEGGINLEGSINWLRDELSKLEEEKDALSPEDLTGDIGAALQAKIDEYTKRLEFLEDYYNVVESRQKELNEKYETEEEKHLKTLAEYDSDYNDAKLLGDEELMSKILAQREEYNNKYIQQQKDTASAEAQALLEGSEEYKALTGDLAKLGVEESRKALDAYRKMVENSEDLSDEAKAEILAGLDDIQEKIDDIELDNLQQQFEDIQSVISSISSILGSFGASSELTEGLSGLSNVIGGLFSVISGGTWVNKFAGIASMIGGIVTVAKSLKGLFSDGNEDLTAGVTKLSTAYQKLVGIMNKAFGDNKAALQNQAIDNIKAQIAEYQKLIDKELAKGNGFLARLFGVDTDEEAIKKYQLEIEKLLGDIASLEEEQKKDFLQTDTDSFVNELRNIWAQSYDSAEEYYAALKKLNQTTIDDIIARWIEKKLVEDQVNSALGRLYESGMTDSAFDLFGQEIQAISDNAKREYEKWQDAGYFQGEEGGGSSMDGSIARTATEAQFNQYLGYVQNLNITAHDILNALRDQPALIDFSALAQISRGIANDVERIKDNTEYCRMLESMKNDLAAIRRGSSVAYN